MRLNLPKLKTLAVALPLLMLAGLARSEGPVDTYYLGPDSDVYIRGYINITPADAYMMENVYHDTAWWGMCVNPHVHYRFRYLNSKYYPADGSFLVVPFNKNTGITTLPLDVPKEEGDVEFFFTSSQNSPYYKYVDYSGMKNGVDEPLGVPGYSEQISFVTNRCAAATSFRTMGRDWYIRIRRGKSNLRNIKLRITEN